MEYLGWGLIFIGCSFNLISALGCLKMPDFYTMLHAAGVGDCCGTPLALIGIIFIHGFDLISLKILALIFLIFLLSPTATNALARAGLDDKSIIKK